MPLQAGFNNPRPKKRSTAQPEFFKRAEEKMTVTPTANNHRPRLNAVKSRDIVTLNVGGLRYQTRRSTLRRYPETLLGKRDRCCMHAWKNIYIHARTLGHMHAWMHTYTHARMNSHDHDTYTHTIYANWETCTQVTYGISMPKVRSMNMTETSVRIG